MAAISGEQAMTLLDFTQKPNIALLDEVVNCFYGTVGPQQQMAQRVLTQFKEHPESWSRVDAILEYSPNQQTKYFALQILENLIRTRWKALPREQCEGIKKYIVGLIIKLSGDPAQQMQEKVFLGKLNVILVQIVKKEWPHNWPTFISDIVGASKTSEPLCTNNMAVLKLLSEEVFDFSAGQMTQVKAKHLKDNMCNEFSQIFELCSFVMDNSQSITLVGATLETLLKFLNWIPLGYIFETKLVSTLIYRFLTVPAFRNVTLKCLTEIAGIQSNSQYSEQLLVMFSLVMIQLKQMLPLSTNIKEAYKNGQDDEQNFIQNLALFLCTFLKEHAAIIEQKPELQNNLLEALHFLVLISEVHEKEIFKICLEYWNYLSAELYRENPFSSSQSALLLGQSVLGQSVLGQSVLGQSVLGQAVPPRRQLYLPILPKVRVVMISRMAKPEEVLVVENEQGEAVREFMKDTDAINMYKSMRETLVYLTHLDYADTERIMTEKLYKQLCWAIGSISGAFHEEDEKRFLVTVIKELLGMVEQKRGKDNKAIIASDIMYVVGQYPRFLRAHWKFLKTVVNKLFEFMHELHDGVQDMACDTFIKIAQKCRRHFVQVQPMEVMPFIEEILNNIRAIICDLQPHHVHTFYEAVGYMIQAQVDSVVQERLIEKYMSLPNEIWDSIIARATSDLQVLQDHDTIKQLGHILKTNVRACTAVGHPFVIQLGRIYLDMLNVYKVLSENISTAVALNGELVTKQPLIASMRTVKKETLKLISCWVSKSQDPGMVREHFLPPLLDAILGDYRRNVPGAREPEVLSTVTAIVERLESSATDDVPPILDSLFQCTLEMINKDLEEFPEHRINFFRMLHAIAANCFESLLRVPAPQFKLLMDAFVWGFKHTMRNVAEIGQDILLVLLQKFATHPSGTQFFQTYLLDLMQHVFSVLTDTSHAGSHTMYATILATMFSLVEDNKIGAPLYDPTTVQAANNAVYVQEYVAQLLKQAFPHLNIAQIKVFVEGLFSLNMDISQFKDHLRDFLVQIKEFSGDDPSDLYLEEREGQLRQAAEEKRRQQLTVPGIINPHDRPDDMQE
eukprot:Em0019g558a